MFQQLTWKTTHFIIRACSEPVRSHWRSCEWQSDCRLLVLRVVSEVCAVYYMSCMCWHLLSVKQVRIHRHALNVDCLCVYLYVCVLPCFMQLWAQCWLEERLWLCASHLGYPYKSANHSLLPCKRSFIDMSASTSHNTVTQHHKNKLLHNFEF